MEIVTITQKQPIFNKDKAVLASYMALLEYLSWESCSTIF